MKPSAISDFLQGLAGGAAAAGVLLAAVVYLPVLTGVTGWNVNAALAGALQWTRDNLGLSLLPFTLTLVLFRITLWRLERRLRDGSPAHRVAQMDQLSDIWIGVFFGIGVLWTAIGMRSALLYGLGEGTATMAAGGPAGLLQRLVHGGILTALTTTIVGGAGGYLLRLYKAVRIGGDIKRFYADLEGRQERRVEELLEQIRDRRSGTALEPRPWP